MDREKAKSIVPEPGFSDFVSESEFSQSLWPDPAGVPNHPNTKLDPIHDLFLWIFSIEQY